MGNLWRAVFDRDVTVSGLRRINGAQFEVNVKIEYDVAFGPFPKERHMRCRGTGSFWEYYRAHRDDWREVPGWIRAEINASVVNALVADRDNILPLKKPA